MTAGYASDQADLATAAPEAPAGAQVLSQAERDRLVLSCVPLAHKLALQVARLSGLPHLVDDLRGTALLALVYAARIYDPRKGRFITIAHIAVRHRLWLAVAVERKQRFRTLDATIKRGPNAGEMQRDLLPDHREARAEETVAHEDELGRLREAIQTLPDRHRKVIQARLDGQTFGQVAAAEGFCEMWTRNLWKAGVQKLAAVLAE
jgi:RNA polymerase sigma factor (sigma-70 family)